MKRKNKTGWVVGCLMAVLLSTGVLKAQSITVGGSNWTPGTTVITEAGSDYSGTLTSTDNQISITSSIPSSFRDARISVHYEANPTWHNSLAIQVKRTGTGSHTCWLCTITGGNTDFKLVPANTGTEFYQIHSNLFTATFSNTPIQLQLTGISVTIPAATYNAKVVFTIAEF
jgi:hypothetical protein